MAISQAGQDATAFILNQIELGVLRLPMDVSLERVAKNTGNSEQNIGSAFDFYIKPSLAEKGIFSRKCGKPKIIQLSKTEADKKPA
ncbi:MAG: hypothetical protein Q8L73_02985 [Methylotenera sp.]|nr:hypothetical protein [Methylotenera sp.]